MAGRNSVRPFRETWQRLRRGLAVTALAAPLVFFSLCQCLFSQSNEAAEVQGSNVGRAMLKNSERSDPSRGGIGGESYKEAVRLYQEGRYVEAANAHQLACDRFDARACTDLGVMYRRGQGVKKDFPRAAEFSLRGCDGGNALGCTNLGLMYWNNVLPKNDKRAVELFGRAAMAVTRTDAVPSLSCTKTAKVSRKTSLGPRSSLKGPAGRRASIEFPSSFKMA